MTEFEEQARRAVEQMIEVDPSFVEVVATMRSQGRSWGKIANCLRRALSDDQPK